jgi:putative hydrolase of the HAD superfamily
MRTLLFDFGNVLGYFDHRIAVRQFVKDCDLDEAACFAAIYDTALEDDFEAGRVSGDEFVRQACAAINYRGTPERFRSIFQDIFRPNPAICELIPRLAKRHRLVLASNTNELHSTHFRETFADVLQHFAALGLSHEAGARKPRREFFEHCQKLAECKPNECLFIDDLASNVDGAREFGWRAIQYTGLSDLLQQLHLHGIEFSTGDRLHE